MWSLLCVDILCVCAVVVALFFVLFFFFQAEDGIRDLVRSRGLGDVYKRQVKCRPCCSISLSDPPSIVVLAAVGIKADQEIANTCRHNSRPVSYTHLTLPTSDLE